MKQAITVIGVPLLAFLSVWWIGLIAERALRDPRFFDGWLLFIAMASQMLFHMRYRLDALIELSELTWRSIHIISGYAIVAIFVVHTGFALPDTAFEWVLWINFAVVIISGMAGNILIRTIPARLERRARVYEYAEIPHHRERIANEAAALVTGPSVADEAGALWNLYANRLMAYFAAPRNLSQHLNESPKPLKALLHRIEACELETPTSESGVFQSLKRLVKEKNDLDFAHAHLLLLRAWSFVHVPATYALFVLVIFHIAAMYAFSTGMP